MRLLALSLLFLPAVACVLVSRQAPTPEADSPLRAVHFRSARNGDVRDGAVMEALRQRNDLVDSSDSAGIWPGGWTWYGPGNVGGRVREILINPTNPSIMLTGSCSGGIWRSTNGGSTWQPMDDFMANMAIGCMKLDPTNPDTIYAGTGEGFFETVEGSSNTAAVRGAGIFKSTDGGLTWNQLPSTNTPDWYFVNRLAISPANNQIILAATSTGIYRSTDGGTTWSRRSTAYTYDLQMNPSNPNLLVAGTHAQGALYSTDNGLTWTSATGLGAPHRTELRYARSNPTTVYAACGDAGAIKIYRSTDGGQTYVLRTTGSGISTYEAYNNVLWVDPANANNLIVGGVYLYRSTDGGATLPQGFSNVHPDMHAIVEDPAYNGTTNLRVYFGTDGGIYRANTWTTSNSVTALNTGLGITQFYGSVFNPANNVIFAGAQDNGTVRYAGNVNGWTSSFGGDGGYCAFDPTNTSYWYGEIYYAQVFRSTNGGTSANYIYSGIGDAGNAAACNFIPFFRLDPNNANTMLMGAERLWRTTNVKATTPTWTSIKPSINNFDSDGGGNASGGGGAHFAENPPFCISTHTVQQGNSDVIWVGHNNGQIWKTTNGTSATPTWTRVDDGAGPMPLRWVSTIAIDPSNPYRVFVAFMGYESGNLWVTNDGGQTWSDASGVNNRLPSLPISAVTVHPTKPQWLYAGTEFGIFVSDDGGATWSTRNQGPSLIPIEQFQWVDATRLFITTHGRGSYMATLSTTTDYAMPTSFAPRYGAVPTGKIEDLYVSENERLTLTPPFNNDEFAPAGISLEGVAPSGVTSLTFKLEANTSTPFLKQRVYLFNYGSGVWELVSTTSTATTDQTVTITPSGDPQRFIQNGTRKIRALATWDVGPVDSAEGWSAAVDLAQWSFTIL